MTEQNIKDILIIGGGTAGMTAALYALRAGNSIEIIENYVHGGQIIVSHEVENYPALPNVTGADFAIKLFEQVEKLGMKMKYETISEIDLTSDIKMLKTNKQTYYGKTVIIATGSVRRTLKVKGESKFSGRGVSYCATCDGAFHQNKPVAVVGGGNTALEDAIFLSKTSSIVYLINRGSEFSGEDLLIETAVNTPNIKIMHNSQIMEIKGDQMVTGISVMNGNTNETEDLELGGVFIAVGVSPNSNLFAEVLNIDEKGYIIAAEDCHTNIEGVFAAGDCRTKTLRQLVTAAADGAVAATEANKYIIKQRRQK
ncbi:MAG: NAD(P)/FAD-dependent oxidoreductase [Bacillota bacterium]|jgi:thioredoxin reductase (NADPH)